VAPPTAAARPAPAAAPIARPAALLPRPAATSTPTPAPAPTVQLDLKQLSAKLDEINKQNYFEILGVRREDDAGPVKVAYFKAAKVFHPDTVPAGAAPEAGKLMADIFARVGEAYRTLSDPKLKATYISELDSGRQGEKVDVAKLLESEELFRRGTLLAKARKFTEAVKAFEDAIEANKEDGELFVWRGFAKFFLHEDKARGLQEATRDINLGLKVKPNSAQAYYFLGVISKLMGDVKTAKQHFSRCVQVDSKHLDAQRELRLMK
jgi:curved DNA-binding protein CbpA